jgi:hypothetical protein
MALLPGRLKEASYHRTIYCATLEHGTTPEELTEPAYWAHCAHFLRSGDRIEAMPESNEWYAEFMVVETGKLFARLVPMRLVHLTPAERTKASKESVDADFAVQWKGGAKWCVIRTHDSAILYRDLSSKVAAEAALADHTKQPIAA